MSAHDPIAPARLTPWHDTEADLARSVATVRANGRIRQESEAWAVALTEARRVFPDVREREIVDHIGDVGELGWLESLVGAIARRRVRALDAANGTFVQVDDDAA